MIFSKKSILLSGIGLFHLTFCISALAAPPPIPDEATRQLKTQEASYLEKTKEVSVKPEKKPEIVVKEEKEAPVTEEGPKFLIKKIKFEGNSLFSEKDFEQYTKPFLNHENSFASLKTLTSLITNHYRSRGYSTSRAYLPPQKIEDNTMTIKIVEAKINKVVVEGNKYFSKKLYQEAIRLREDRVFQYQDLESSLYFLNREPDRKAKAYIVAGDEPETSDIVLKVEETNPLHVYYDFNNRGSKFTHLARHSVHFDDDSLFGQADVLNTSATFADEGAFNGGSVAYSYPIQSTGTTLSLSANYVQTMLVRELKPFEVKGKSFGISPNITQVFLKKPTVVIEGYLGFEIKDSKTILDGPKINFDRDRVLRAGPRFTFQDASGRTNILSDIHWGIPDFLGSAKEVSLNASRPNSGGDFIYYTGTLSRIQSLPLVSFLTLRATGQWSRDNMTSLERFSIGGAYSVRGYPEGDSSGDYGYNASAELNVPVPFLPSKWRVPFTNKTWTDTVRLVGFVDTGKTYNRERTANTAVKDKFLLGTGVGIRVDLGRTFSLQLDLGYPIGDESSDPGQKQVHFSMSCGF